MGDADPELEPPARNLMQIGAGLGELIDRLRIDRRYGGGKWNALGRQCEPDALHMLPKELDTEIPAKPRRSISRAASSVARRRPGSAIRLRAGKAPGIRRGSFVPEVDQQLAISAETDH